MGTLSAANQSKFPHSVMRISCKERQTLNNKVWLNKVDAMEGRTAAASAAHRKS